MVDSKTVENIINPKPHIIYDENYIDANEKVIGPTIKCVYIIS